MKARESVVGRTASKVLGALSIATVLGASPIAQAAPPIPEPCGEITRATRVGMKFYAGHYVATSPGRTDEHSATRLTTTLDEIENIPGVVGVQHRFFWSELQNDDGTYNFAKVRLAMREARERGKKLSIFLSWKFNPPGKWSPVPTYVKNLTDDPVEYKLGGEGRGEHARGKIAAFNNPVVANEFIKLLRRLKDVVDTNPTVATISFPETALGIDWDAAGLGESLAGRQALSRKFVDNFILVARHAGCIFRKTPVITSAHFPEVRLPDLTDAFKKASIGYGGADIWMDDDDVEGEDKAYGFYPRVQGELPIGIIAAGGNYMYWTHHAETIAEELRGPYKNSTRYGWDASETIVGLANKAIGQLYADFIFWKKNGDEGDMYYRAFLTHARSLTRAEPTLRNTRQLCPTRYYSCVSE